jgi:broad specificity phosphatase PhoE
MSREMSDAAHPGRLVLVRHAETTNNAAGVFDSRPPGAPLSELGVGQAEALATRLANHPVRTVMASTALRAQETARPTARSHGLEVELHQDLLEVDLGDLEGTSGSEALQTYIDVAARWKRGETAVSLPGGESWNDVATRMIRVLPPPTELRTPGSDVVLVGHSGSLQILLAHLLGHDSPAASGALPNTGVTILLPQPDATWTLESFEVMSMKKAAAGYRDGASRISPGNPVRTKTT